jgi:hypothetical protein
MHCNVVTFLESGPGTKISIEGPVHVSGIDMDIIDLDVGITHPFSGQTIYTGFDVKGIFISRGLAQGVRDLLPESIATTRLGGPLLGSLLYGHSYQLKLMNADGYTDLWNGDEYYPITVPIFSYVPGELGTKPYTNEAPTINPYKVFAKGLPVNSDLSSVSASDRLYFPAGSKLVRHYKIKYGLNILENGIDFNYAVDACWEPPLHKPPTSVPGDFPLNANQDEPVIRSVEITGNTLTTIDGSFKVTVSAFDHQGDSLTVNVFAPEVISGWIPLSPAGSGKWSRTIVNHLGPDAGFYTYNEDGGGWTFLWASVRDNKGNESLQCVFLDVEQKQTPDWTNPVQIASNDPSSFVYDSPRCAFDSSGQLHLIFRKHYMNFDQKDQFIYWRSGQGTAHVMSFPTADPNYYPEAPDIAIDNTSGMVCVVFFNRNGSPPLGRASYFSFTGDPPATPAVNDFSSVYSNDPQIEATDSQVYVCWISGAVTAERELYGGQGFPPATPMKLTDEDTRAPFDPQLCLSDETPVIAYRNGPIGPPEDEYIINVKYGFSAPGVDDWNAYIGEEPTTFSVDSNGSDIGLVVTLDDYNHEQDLGIWHLEWPAGSEPDPDGFKLFVWNYWDVVSVNSAQVLYDSLGSGMVFYQFSQWGFDPCYTWTGYLPSSAPHVDPGIITGCNLAQGSFHAEISSDGEIAMAFADIGGSLYYTTAN